MVFTNIIRNSSPTPFTCSGVPPLEIKRNTRKLNADAFKQRLKEQGFHSITCAQAYAAQPVRPVTTSFSIIEDMDHLVVREWYEHSDSILWDDSWFRIVDDKYIVPVCVLCFGSQDGIHVLLSPQDEPISCDGTDLGDEWARYGITCEALPRRRAMSVHDAVSATVVEVSLHDDGFKNAPVAWFSVIGVNHLPLILQNSQSTLVFESCYINEWCKRVSPRGEGRISIIHSYRDAWRFENNAFYPQVRSVLANGRGNIIPLDIQAGIIAHVERGLCLELGSAHRTVSQQAASRI